MARAFWSGEVSFGLVTIPVKLYSATQDKTPSFHQLHKECGSRISMVRQCPKCNRPVEWGEIGKGYEVAKGEYALFTKEELAKLDGDGDGAASGGGIDIVEFVDPKEIDLAYIGKSYWVGPGGKSARGFELLREALEKTHRVALAKVKLRTRTQLGMLRPRGKLFSLDTMRFADEMVPADDIALPEHKAATDRELQLALNLVEQLSGPFDPAKHPDEYRANVEAAAAEKVERDEIAREGATEEDRAAVTAGGKVIDLAELLARSLGAAGGPASAGPKKAKPAAPAEEAKPGPKKGKAAGGGKKKAAGE